MASTLDRIQAAAPGSGKLHLFDFARPHHFVEESVFAPPPPGERRYYVETSHFYPWLGDKILAAVFAGGEQEEAVAAGDPFGREIGHGAGAISIDSDIATARADLDLWESMHADDVGHVRTLISH